MRTGYITILCHMIIALALIIAPPASADDTLTEKTIDATPLPENSTIDIDGILTDRVWQQANWFSDFRQSVPKHNAPASEPTKAAIVYDRNNLYIAIVCTEKDVSNIKATNLRHRDAVMSDDLVAIALDTYQDQTRGYLFAVNPLGAKEESQINGANSYNWDWDAIWYAATVRTDHGWQVEIRIPLAILSFAEVEHSTWGINIRRSMLSRNEQIYMSPPPPPFDISSFNYAATLRGLKNLEQKSNIHVTPYALVKGSEDDQGQSNTDTEMGVDIKYSVSSDLTLDLTANTDFAQVEADNEQVNLSRYSLYYPEKRDFFLENAQLFSFLGGYYPGHSLMPFFSRRIGIYQDQAVPINMGARLSGKLAGNDIGLLSIQTDSVDSLGLDTGLYNVARVRRNIDGRSYIGGIFTSSDRGDFNSKTFGVDGQWYFNPRTYLSAYYTAVDSDELDNDSEAYSITLDYTSDLFGYALTTQRVGANYLPDLGFVPRLGIRRNNGSIRKSWRLHDNLVRKYTLRLSGDWTYTLSGEPESSNKQLTFEVEFESGDSFNYKYQRAYEQLFGEFHLSDSMFFSRGEYKYNTNELEFSSSGARRWEIELSYYTGGYFAGDRTDFHGSLSFIFNKHLNASGSYSQYNITNGDKELDWRIFRGRVNVIFNSYMSLAGLFQYNSSTDTYSTNLRFRWIHSNDSDLFIVINDIREENALDQLELVGREAVIKVNYRFLL